MSKKVLDNPNFKTVYSEISELYLFSSAAFRKLMSSTLLLNNFGRSVRQVIYIPFSI
jgi:hypothetical protein